MKRPDHELMTRRELLGVLGGATIVVACGEPGAGGTTGDGTTAGPGGTTGDDVVTTGDATGGSTSGVDCAGEASAWASGGTAAMLAKHCYPDPFAGGVMQCALLCEQTAGPCTAAAPEREDISEGYPGLPVRLALLVVDADTCAPVGGARVEVWHTQRSGVYSGVTPMPMFCAGGDADAPNHNYFRGSRTAGADGRVAFDTCFPGWYPGRAVHIHLRVYVGDERYATSQLYFDPGLTGEIFAGHPEYVMFGPPDTSNADDGIIGGASDVGRYLLDTQRMPDGAMLASKVIAIRSSLAAPTCKP